MDFLSNLKDYNKYAPGIATYGIDGAKGDTGTDGNCIFYTDYDVDCGGRMVNNSTDYATFVSAINSNKMMQRANKDRFINRPYKNGDYIITSNGYIYELYDIKRLDDNVNGSDCFRVVGRINPDNTDNNGYFKTIGTDNRLYMQSLYNGITITKADLTDLHESDYNLCVAADYSTADENGRTNLLSLVSTYSGDDDGYMNFYFDNTRKTFVLDTNRPLLINTDYMEVDVTQENKARTDGYSSVLVKDNSMTSFINTFKRYTCYYDIVDVYVDNVLFNRLELVADIGLPHITTGIPSVTKSPVQQSATSMSINNGGSTNINSFSGNAVVADNTNELKGLGIVSSSSIKYITVNNNNLICANKLPTSAVANGNLVDTGIDNISIPSKVLEILGISTSNGVYNYPGFAVTDIFKRDWLDVNDVLTGGKSVLTPSAIKKSTYYNIRFTDSNGKVVTLPDGVVCVVYFEDGTMQCGLENVLSKPAKIGIINMVEYVMIPIYGKSESILVKEELNTTEGKK